MNSERRSGRGEPVTTVETSCVIAAPTSVVFAAIADVERFASIVPEITTVEFLTDRHRGIGTRYTETRVLRRREVTSVIEVTVHEPDRLLRHVSDEGGAVWETTFVFLPSTSGGAGPTQVTEVQVSVTATAYTVGARVLTPLLAPLVRRAAAADLEHLAAHCAGQPEGGGGPTDDGP